MKNNIINIYYINVTFRDIAECVAAALSDRMEVRLTHTLDPKDTNVWLLFGVNDLPPATLLPQNYIVYQLEQICIKNNQWLTQKYLSVMQRAKQVWDYSMLNVRTLQGHKVPSVFYVPIAYNKCLTLPLKAPIEKDIDVLFIGSVNMRRKVILDQLLAKGIKVEIHNGGLWGEKRHELQRRAKIHLNLHYYDKDALLEMARLSVILANRGFVISERGCDGKLEKKIEGGVVFGMYDELVSLCVKYLAADQEAKRLQIAAKGFKLFSETTLNIPINCFTLVKACSNTNTNTTSTSNNTSTSTSTSKSTSTSSTSTKSVLIEPALATAEFDAIALLTDSDGMPSIKVPELKEYPSVSLITPTRNRKNFISMMIHQVEQLDYPKDKLEWIIVDDSDDPADVAFMQETLRLNVKIKYTFIHDNSIKSICAKRNHAANLATGIYICHIDDDDFYFEHSLKTKVAFLEDSKTNQNNQKQCIGTANLAIFNLLDDTSIVCKSNQLGEASMLYAKSFWAEQPFGEHAQGEGYVFTMGRREACLDLPYLFNMVAINHGSNVTGETRLFTGSTGSAGSAAAGSAGSAASAKTTKTTTTTNLFDVMDDETQDILCHLKKYLKSKKESKAAERDSEASSCPF